MTIADHEVADLQQGTSEVDREVADEESQDTTAWVWRPKGDLTSWICCLSLGLSDGGDQFRQAQSHY